jgi:hypothetical protein
LYGGFGYVRGVVGGGLDLWNACFWVFVFETLDYALKSAVEEEKTA